MGYSLGVDLGTTFTAVAVDRTERIEMLTLGDRTVVAPAVVFARDDGGVVTGDAAVRRAMSEPFRTGREFKRRLGDPTPLMLGGTPYSAVALLGYLLRDALHKVTETEGEAPENVVLTHPANWGPYRRELFDEVPRLGGLDEVRKVTEPEAAAAYYAAKRRLDDGEVVAVYDLGGGTFDATVLRKLPDGIAILGSPEGIERLGGVDFDEAVLNHVDRELNGAIGELPPQDPQAATALRRLRQDCIEAKEALSIDTETTIPVFLPNRHCEVRLTRAEFEDMIRVPIESTIEALRRALRSARVEPAELAAVLLVGGSSRIPLVARMVSEELRRPTAVDAHPKYAVALGAAALAGVETGHEGASLATAKVIPAARSSGNGGNGGLRTETVQEPAPAAAGGGGTPPPETGGRGGGGGEPGGEPPGRRGGRARAAVTGVLGKPRNIITLAAAVLGVLVLVGTLSLFGGGVGPDVQAPGPRVAEPIVPGPAVQPNAFAASLPNPTPAPDIGVAAPRGVAVTPDGRYAFVTSRNTSRVSVIDVAGGRVVASVFLKVPPQFVAVAPDGRRAYVSAYPPTGPENEVAVIDVASATVIAEVPVGKHPYTLSVSPDGRQVYVPDHDSAEISVMSTDTNSVEGVIRVPRNPHSVSFSPDGQTAYVANHESNLVSVVDTATRSVTGSIPVPPSPHSTTITPDGTEVLVASYDAGTVSTIDTGSKKVVATTRVGAKPSSVAIAPDGRHAYVVNEGSNSVSVIATGNDQVTATVPVGRAPVVAAVTPDGRQAYVTNVNSNSVSVLNTGQ
ncbi:YVTN family beta-propeller protein [Saccharopolyspora erythraea NRRL 2338]|uniref:Surface layer protein n=4 Tax=Saccharopolyspora erythraea TaxID=1836 RepID=A4FEW4_SACEN|nr:Hsp70 family protein [Saccharopolyspora erythraea]PFG96315.1 YVTN family beta-propeller protein [Saccharopolyspora erythraea NRRL 2338]QRK92832.1 Hsp70 family protein [Saccharopolyspora erythraea]CAM02589.1 putative surface layer protein [Saccharopolyspora erythraea NRRL 2338]